MSSTIDDFEALKKIAQGGVQKIAQTFTSPNADFIPVFQYVDGAGKFSLIGLKSDTGDEREKNLFVALIERTIRAERARAASLMISVWFATVPVALRERVESGQVRASTAPNRKEKLWLQVVDATRYEVYMADLIRHEGAPPTVSEWTAVEEFQKAEGRFQLQQIYDRALGRKR